MPANWTIEFSTHKLLLKQGLSQGQVISYLYPECNPYVFMQSKTPHKQMTVSHIIHGLLVFFIMGLSAKALAQTEETQYTWQTFRDTRIINGHSVESGMKGEMKFIISHRFGTLNSGAFELFGLDQGTIRYGLDYAISNNLDVGIGRSSFQKTFDGYVKYKFKSQSSGGVNMPVSATVLLGSSINTLPWQNRDLPFPISNRMSYTGQLIVARKFSHRFSLQVMPTYLHRNYVLSPAETNDLVFAGVAGRYQVSKVMALQVEYYPRVYGTMGPGRTNSLSLGFEFQTKAHVFQFHVSNSTGMVENLFLSETMGTWDQLDLRLGFNITRDFKIAPRKF